MCIMLMNILNAYPVLELNLNKKIFMFLYKTNYFLFSQEHFEFNSNKIETPHYLCLIVYIK